MNHTARKRVDSARRQIEEELRGLHAARGVLNPADVVSWAEANPNSALHARFQWDDTKAAREYRLWQAREIIAEVEVTYDVEEGRTIEVRAYHSLPDNRGAEGGYESVVSIMTDAERRAVLLAQAKAELRRVRAQYRVLTELARVFEEIDRL